MPGIGPHPKGIHHWWARLPLPTARAVLFASVVDDPSEHPSEWPTEEEQDTERERLFDIIRLMMGKKLHERPEVYALALKEMLKHCDGKLPSVFDPFAGGGSIPLEANRLGFEAYAGDLNPVAVLLNKCNLEIAPPYANQPPVNQEDRKNIGGTETWRGLNGLAGDVRYYSRLVEQRAKAQIHSLYPKARLPKDYANAEANVIAWVWARTVASPDPAARGKHVPLISTYWLSSKKGAEAWLAPVVDRESGTYRYEVRNGPPNDRVAVGAGTKKGKRGFRCLLTDTPIPFEYIRSQGQQGLLGFTMIAIVAEIRRGRFYLAANDEHESISRLAEPKNFPTEELIYDSRYLTPPGYGMRTIDSLFTARQLTAMVTLSDLVRDVHSDVRKDALAADLSSEDADAYARAVTIFLGLAVDRTSDFNNTLCRWSQSNQKVMNLFGRQVIPIVWDFAEANTLGESVGSWSTCSGYVADCIEVLNAGSLKQGHASQIDAAQGGDGLHNLLVSTDPPYYDNVPYADISDFFYVWLRRTIGHLCPDLFSTLLVPKLPELTASPGRFDGDKEKAKNHFEDGFRRAFAALGEKMDRRFPLTVYYAFKQDDEDTGIDVDEASTTRVDLTTGWETLLEALISSGFYITGTWPVRASQAWRMRAMGANALASYIVLACRSRPSDAPQTDRRSFVAELKRDLPSALRHLQQGNIAPVDFAQAAIGPGMAVFSRHSRIVETSGKAMTVRAALSLINQTLSEVLSQQDDEFDADTRWAIAWFEQMGFRDGDFGEAEVLSKAKVTSIGGLQHAGIIGSKGGKVRLLRPEELSSDWDPQTDKRLTIWETTHQTPARLLL